MLVIPSNPLPQKELSPTMVRNKPRSVSEDWTDPDIYVNVKVSKYFTNCRVLISVLFQQKQLSNKKSSKTLGGPVPPELMRELNSKLKKT